MGEMKKPAETVAPARFDVVNDRNEKLREVNVSGEVFGTRVKGHLLYEVVKQHRAGARAGTHMTKNRALVSGSGKKPWRQKGTGRARVGETRNPLWRHGGTVFGPVPRDYSYTMPRKAVKAALRSALSQRAAEGAVRVVDRIPVEMPSERPFRLTQQLKGVLQRLAVPGRALVIDYRPSPALQLSGRNLPGVKVVDVSAVNVYDVLEHPTLVVSHEALIKLEERLLP